MQKGRERVEVAFRKINDVIQISTKKIMKCKKSKHKDVQQCAINKKLSTPNDFFVVLIFEEERGEHDVFKKKI